MKSCRIDAELHRLIKIESARKGITFHDWLAEAITDKLHKEGEQQ